MCIKVIPYGKCTKPDCTTRVKWEKRAELTPCQLSQEGKQCQTTERSKDIDIVCEDCQLEEVGGGYEYGPTPLPNPSK
ncbi:hypothetical protein FOYG_13519 [Fusarium oxysporum NRRL 32931]|uniref:Uncharacterized protein n=3 Tax=Fusarium oxysporum TaxID=5507 RepID=W9HM82_FUSOX|nr:hypothetical protein FOYG_13519 [Fusarium oxysporum NRRL 32931]KAH7469525.1 hypothetical protein FOMA001_g14445 [Fusarium oxysporum f. sp. matthiolae]KAJ0142347.1 5'-hydroxyaverantin dehydrogenase [Fusarium oxysporum f. sp. albedinis]RKK93045.1 hypothetical protein BFJ71_g9804 [Fusarium oxysporum]KAK2474139.1 hypothetical protein H9L39_14099 [Fusarium oxysporum f. sp. albedinis]